MRNSSNPIIIDDAYSLCNDKVGNMFAKCVGAQSGVKKRTIWVAKPIVTNFLGPNDGVVFVTPQNRHLADDSDHATIYMMSLWKRTTKRLVHVGACT
jgi:hypothetical protein